MVMPMSFFPETLGHGLIEAKRSHLQPRSARLSSRKKIPAFKEVPMTHAQALSAQEELTRAAIGSFREAFARHDVDALAECLTDDTVFEDIQPAPDGRRVEGKAAVVEYWRGWFARNPGARFDTEEVILSGDRVIVRWIYRKMRDGQPWHLRGVDIFAIREGKIAAKLVYAKR
jgi:ketosteroid isomerase-like protein